MDSDKRERLQSIYSDLLDNVSDYDGIADDLFSQKVINRNMKERIVSLGIFETDFMVKSMFLSFLTLCMKSSL